MTSPNLGLLSLLVTVVSDEIGDAKVIALATPWNLATAADNQVKMTSPNLGLLSLLVTVVRDEIDDAKAIALATP